LLIAAVPVAVNEDFIYVTLMDMIDFCNGIVLVMSVNNTRWENITKERFSPYLERR